MAPLICTHSIRLLHSLNGSISNRDAAEAMTSFVRKIRFDRWAHRDQPSTVPFRVTFGKGRRGQWRTVPRGVCPPSRCDRSDNERHLTATIDRFICFLRRQSHGKRQACLSRGTPYCGPDI